MPKKLTYEFVKESFKKEGYKLLSTIYKNNTSKLLIKCNNNHIFKMDYKHFKDRKQRCPKCHYKLISHNIEYIKEQISIIAPNYKLLSTEYLNNCTKLKFKCDKNHKFFMLWRNFQSGQRCAECYYESKRKNYTKEELLRIINYRSCVVKLSNKNYKKYKNIINPNNIKRGRVKYHLDHIYSVMDGFKNNISFDVISNPYNLKLLYYKDNLNKFDNSWQSKDDLYKGYNKFKEYKELSYMPNGNGSGPRKRSPRSVGQGLGNCKKSKKNKGYANKSKK